jgi:hypothetical protein
MTRRYPTAKSRTKSGHTSATAKPDGHEGRQAALRTIIAHSAARLIAEGLTDYYAAKQKAARQFGVNASHSLPDNDEIDLALREHLALFAHETQPRVLSALRETAVRVMLRLERFSPWLVGAVLNGTANEYSEIELELIGIESKEFELYLLNAGVEFELCAAHHGKSSMPMPKATPMKYRLECCGAPVSITLYSHPDARQTGNPRGSTRHKRAQRADAERLFMECRKS